MIDMNEQTPSDPSRVTESDLPPPQSDVEPVPPPRFDASVADAAPRSSRAGGRGLAGLLAVSLSTRIRP